MTMLETLIVIALIAALAALLFPVANGAIESSSMIKCMQKMRSVGFDIRTYAAENQGFLPWYVRSKGYSGMWWYSIYQPGGFTNYNERMTCPSEKDYYKYQYKYNGQELHSSYSYNKYLGYQDRNGVWIYERVNFITMTQQSKIAMLADHVKFYPDKADDTMGFEEWGQVIKAHKSQTAGNVMLMDGHIEAISTNKPANIVLSPTQLK